MRHAPRRPEARMQVTHSHIQPHRTTDTLSYTSQGLYLFLPRRVYTFLRQEVVSKGLSGRYSLRRIQLQTPRQEKNSLGLTRFEIFFASTDVLGPACRPHDDFFPREPLLTDAWDGGLEERAMEKRTLSYPSSPADGRNLDHGFDVVGGIKKGEAFREDGQEDDAGGPDVDLGRLAGAFQ